MANPEVGIVVIEDDHHISDLVAMYLRRDGFRVAPGRRRRARAWPRSTGRRPGW